MKAEEKSGIGGAPMRDCAIRGSLAVRESTTGSEGSGGRGRGLNYRGWTEIDRLCELTGRN